MPRGYRWLVAVALVMSLGLDLFGFIDPAENDYLGGLRGLAEADYVTVLIAAAAISLVATTIRLTAFARREQTAIMKLVGATNWYIRLPFVLEGVVASVVGAFASIKTPFG